MLTHLFKDLLIFIHFGVNIYLYIVKKATVTMPSSKLKNVLINSSSRLADPVFLQGDFRHITVEDGRKVELEGTARKILVLAGHVSVKGAVGEAQAEGRQSSIAVEGDTDTARGLYGGVVNSSGDIGKAYAIKDGQVKTSGTITTEVDVILQGRIEAREIVPLYGVADPRDGVIIETG